MTSPHHATAYRYRNAIAHAKATRHRDPAASARSSAAAEAHAAQLPPDPLTYVASYRDDLGEFAPHNPPPPRRAHFHAPPLATRRQLVTLAKAALGITGQPFRAPQDAGGETSASYGPHYLSISPAPLRPEDISDDEV